MLVTQKILQFGRGVTLILSHGLGHRFQKTCPRNSDLPSFGATDIDRLTQVQLQGQTEGRSRGIQVARRAHYYLADRLTTFCRIAAHSRSDTCRT